MVGGHIIKGRSLVTSMKGSAGVTQVEIGRPIRKGRSYNQRSKIQPRTRRLIFSSLSTGLLRQGGGEATRTRGWDRYLFKCTSYSYWIRSRSQKYLIVVPWLEVSFEILISCWSYCSRSFCGVSKSREDQRDYGMSSMVQGIRRCICKGRDGRILCGCCTGPCLVCPSTSLRDQSLATKVP